MASGAIKHLALAGYHVVALERPNPTCVRRLVCFAEACYQGKISVEGVDAVLVDSWTDVLASYPAGMVPVLVDPNGDRLPQLEPDIIVDARMLKGRKPTELIDDEKVIGLGPGFRAPDNCHAVVETNRGSSLGRVICSGSAQSYTGEPTPVDGVTHERVLRASAGGIFQAGCDIGESVKKGQALGRVGHRSLITEIDGVVRGLLHSHVQVISGQKIGDIDPRGDAAICTQMSDKANAIGLGVLEAVKSLTEQ